MKRLKRNENCFEMSYDLRLLVVTFSSIHKFKYDVYHEARQSDSCLAKTGFAAFGKGVQLISGSPYAETEQLSLLASPSGILLTIVGYC